MKRIASLGATTAIAALLLVPAGAVRAQQDEPGAGSPPPLVMAHGYGQGDGQGDGNPGEDYGPEAGHGDWRGRMHEGMHDRWRHERGGRMGPDMRDGRGWMAGRCYGMAPAYGMWPGMMMERGYHAMWPGYGMAPWMMPPWMMPPWMMHAGYGRWPGYGMGPGRYGMWHGRMGPRYGMGSDMIYGAPQAQGGKISADDVRAMLQRRVARNPNIKVGTVKEANGKITAEVVTQDGSLVSRFQVDPETGRWTPDNGQKQPQ